MTHRQPRGGSITPARAGMAMLGACLVVPMLLAGCSGGDHHHGGWNSPRYHQMTIVLNVSDGAANAIGDATIWVDGVAQQERTSSQFVALGSDYPESWQGFLANWIKPGFTVVTYGASDVAQVTVTVSKPGYYSQATTFSVDDAQPAEVFARDTFVLDPSPNPAAADVQKPKLKDKPGEVVGWSKPKAP